MSFLFAPSSEDIARLTSSFENLDAHYPNPTAKGAALDNFMKELFEVINLFTVSTKLRNQTNQIDCTVKNQIIIRHSVLDLLGDYFIMECKNESKKVPNNTYFKKLESNMLKYGCKFGIIVSRNTWALPECKLLAWESYLKHNIIIINLCDDDFKNIIYHKANLLDVIHNKCIYTRNNASVPLF